VQSGRPGPSGLWIIGYGNPQRRDDGIGSYVVARLNEILRDRKEFHFRTLYQLEPALLEELRDARLIVLVDATINELEDGWGWVRIQPESGVIPHSTHHFSPSFLLALLDSVYHRSPQTWLASVQGNDFGFGEGLTEEAEMRAEKAVSGIVKLFETKGIDKTDESVKL